MSEFLHSLPKAEIHLHLEGSVRPATLLEIAPRIQPGKIDSRYRYADFQGFLNSYAWVTGHLREPRDFELITRRLLAELQAQGVVYLELNVSVGVMLWRNQDVEANFAAIERAVAGQNIPVRYLFDGVRQFGEEHVQHVAEWAVRLKHRGVSAFGVGGDEARGPIENFRATFEYARREGLHLAPHAGETTGPDSIWNALELGAERIGHGIRAIDDPVLVSHLAQHRIPLEISIVSNVCTGAVARLADHPVRKLFDAGVPVILNTDDPAMFHTTLLNEYETAAREFGFTESELRTLAQNSLDYAFARKEGETVCPLLPVKPGDSLR